MAKRHEPQARLLDGSDLTMPATTLQPSAVEHGVPAIQPQSLPAVAGTELADLRQAAMMQSPEQQRIALGQYLESRTSFRQWLLEQMTKGVHYGFPPGIEPKTKEINGVTHYGMWKKGRDGNKGEMVWYPETQWKPRESLYQSGADFIIDLMGLRLTLNADEAAWRMAGGKAGQIVMRCDLYSQQTGQKIGEGFGARENGQKGGDLNNSVKMACKAAKVAAVINAYALSDLFSQDLEDLPKRPQYDVPEQDDDAPQVPPRGDRCEPVTSEEIGKLIGEWKTWQNGEPTREDFAKWAVGVTGGEWNPSKPAQWNRTRLNACWDAHNAAVGVPE